MDYPINAETALLRAAIVCETAASLNGTRETAFEMLMCDIEAGERESAWFTRRRRTMDLDTQS